MSKENKVKCPKHDTGGGPCYCDNVSASGSNELLCCPSYAIGLRCMFDSQRHNKCGEKPCVIKPHKDFIIKT
jgi:hypothetical protein